jgi:small-conductance mechanosensitive channel
VLVLLLICGAAWAFAAPQVAADSAGAAGVQTGAAAAALSAVQTQQLIDTLNDPDRRAALIAALESLQKAAQTFAPPPPPASPATARPAGALEPNGLGAQVIANGARLAGTVSGGLLLAVQGIADVPALLSWLRSIVRDPAMLLDGAASMARLLCVVLFALGAEFLVWRMTHRFYDSLTAEADHQDRLAQADQPADTKASAVHHVHLKDGWLLLRRLPLILVALTVDLVPPLAFLAVATVLLETPLGGSDAVRAVILAVVNAYVIVRIVGSVARATVGAPSARLRLFSISGDAAHYLMVWVRRIAVVVVFGYAVSQLGLFFGMNSEIRQAVLRLISLVIHAMLVVMVLQCRRTLAARLSGPEQGILGALRNRLASLWHIYAITIIVGAWIIDAAEVHNGFERLIDFVLSTIAVGLVARVADIVLVGALDRAFSLAKNDSSRFARIEERAARYHQSLRFLLRFAISTAAVLALFQVWGLDALGWFSSGALGSRLAGSAATLILTLGVAVVVWEAINVAMQIYLDELAQQGTVIRAARLRTIVPLLRNTLLIALMVLIVLTALSELGVNIGPLLAGASIFGVALGFGSQKLVQDFITGIFLLVENAMQVGDTVTAGGLSGTVENLSIRTLRLRAGDGSVHLIPFSSVSTVTNSNRGLGNAPVAVTVDYEEDSDRVGAVLTRVVAEMRGDKAFARGMLSDLQLWGVDRIDGTTMTLAGQIVCTDAARWDVQREFNRRVKIAFQNEGIRMIPIVSLTGFRHPLDIRLEQPAAASATSAADAAAAERPPA